jgi:hypothetical protein
MTTIMESTRKRSITGPSHPHSPECGEGDFPELRAETRRDRFRRRRSSPVATHAQARV